MPTTIVTDQRQIDGTSVRYTVDKYPSLVRRELEERTEQGKFYAIPDLRDTEKMYYLNPAHVFVIHEKRELV